MSRALLFEVLPESFGNQVDVEEAEMISKPKLPKLMKPLATYAMRYGVALSTVKRWRSRGIDLDKPGEVEAFWANKTQGRKSGVKKRDAESEDDFCFPAPNVDQEVKLEAGAAAALARLVEMEVAAYEQMAWAMQEGKTLPARTPTPWTPF